MSGMAYASLRPRISIVSLICTLIRTSPLPRRKAPTFSKVAPIENHDAPLKLSDAAHSDTSYLLYLRRGSYWLLVNPRRSLRHPNNTPAGCDVQYADSCKMDNEKERQSGEQARDGPADPILPTVNPAVTASEKPEPAKGGIHPAFYIAYVLGEVQQWRC